MTLNSPESIEWLVVANENGCAYIEGELECLLTRPDNSPGLEWEVVIPYDHHIGEKSIEPLLPLNVDGMIAIARRGEGEILHGIVSTEDYHESEVRIKAVNTPTELSDKSE